MFKFQKLKKNHLYVAQTDKVKRIYRGYEKKTTATADITVSRHDTHVSMVCFV